jgi:hypothetical protein
MVNMRWVGLLFTSLLCTRLALACSCVSTGPAVSACSSFLGTETVFLGRVIQDSGEGYGKGPARMAVEEILHGIPKDLSEVEVDTMAGTSCYMRLAKDERYVIYGSRDAKRKDLIHYHACSYSFNLRGNERKLDGLRQVEAGGPPKLLGKVYTRTTRYSWEANGPAGLTVIAQGAGFRQETKTQSDGQFEFATLPPGEYSLSIPSPDFFLDSDDYLANKTVNLPARGCADQSLYVWQNGRIVGIVRSQKGEPIEGVPVQVFAFNAKNVLETQKLREQKTDLAGRYEIKGLPPGDYVIGVNAEKYSDTLPYSPTVYPGRSDRDEAERIHVGAAETRTGIDLALHPPREKAALLIEIVFEDDTPAPDAGANIQDPTGVQRFSLNGNRDANNKERVRRIDVFRGESYQMKAFNFKVQASDSGNSAKMSTQEWRGESGLIPMDAPEKRVRIVLHPVIRRLP